MTRAFAAIFPPQEVRNSIWELAQELKASGAGVKWVEKENLHLTLRFFGNLTDMELDKAGSAMKALAGVKRPFTVRLATLGAFPSLSRPRVIWVGVEEGREPLVDVATSLEQQFVEAGLGSTDKPFSPHLTIGRVKIPHKNPRLEEAIRSLTFGGLEFMISGLTLTKSELRPQGPIYSPVLVAELGVAGQ